MYVSDKTLNDLGWPQLVAHWAKRCATSRGAALVSKSIWLETPEQADIRGDEIAEARLLLLTDGGLSLGGIVDCDALLDRVRKAAALEANELIAVAVSLRVMAQCKRFLAEHGNASPRLAQRVKQLEDLGHVFLPILDAFDADGKLVDHASDELGPLRRSLAAIKAQLDKRMKTLLEDERYAPYLQDSYYTEREERCVLPIRTDGKGFVRGIVHGSSQSGQTLFIEPDEIVDLNNRKKLAECDVADEERRILARFSTWIGEEIAPITVSFAVYEQLDLVAAAARLAEDTVASKALISPLPQVRLLHARHPLMLLAERRCVANDVTIAAGQTLVISGPNAGGKTVVLKTVGLIALMVRAGLHITAEPGSETGWFEQVFSDIGDAQNLEQNLSTFSGHLKNIAAILSGLGAAGASNGPTSVAAELRPLQAQDQSSLVLIDEIAVGTDPEQGSALATACLAAFAHAGATGIVTTHFERLKALAVDDARFANASVGFDMAKLEPTFKLHLGSPGTSGAFQVAKRMGLPLSVVEHAQSLVGSGAHRVDELLANVAEQRRKLEEERVVALAELEAAESDRANLRLAKERILARYEKQTRSAHGDAVSSLKVARRELDDLRRQLRDRAAEIARINAETSAESLRVQQDQLRQLGRDVESHARSVAVHEPVRAKLPGAAPQLHQLVVGTPVLVNGIGKGQARAILDSSPSDGKIAVRMGGIRALVDIAALQIDSHRSARRAAQHAKRDETPDKPDGLPQVVLIDGSQDGKAFARSAETTIDVRGQRMDEAVAAVDRFIDEAMLAAREVVFVIHGHGTGVLRTAIRSHVATHRGIKSSRAGESSEGGDGVTVLFLQ